MAKMLENKVAIITGAASGIGRSTALIFAREGASMLLADVDEAGATTTLDLVRQAGAKASFVRVDVTKSRDVNAMVAKAVSDYGRIDCAFNNAGVDGKGALTHECDEENWNQVIAVNLTGVWLCMKAEIAQMLKQGPAGGAIVNTSSDAGLTGFKGLPAYVASKHGVAGLTRAAALEYGGKNIRINAVCPGPIRTPMLNRLTRGSGEMEVKFARAQPLKRLGDPHEVGEAVAWLCSDRASYVTGLPMPVDGGYIAQ